MVGRGCEEADRDQGLAGGGAGTVQDGWSDDWHLQGHGTFLHAACYKGHFAVVKLLIEVGGKELLMLTDRVSAFSWCAEYSLGCALHF